MYANQKFLLNAALAAGIALAAPAAMAAEASSPWQWAVSVLARISPSCNSSGCVPVEPTKPTKPKNEEMKVIKQPEKVRF